jgi:hypothetical protein
VQPLVLRLIQEEFTPLLNLTSPLPEAVWFRAVALADPTFLYCTAQEPTIRICPKSYKQLRECLQQELSKTA